MLLSVRYLLSVLKVRWTCVVQTWTRKDFLFSCVVCWKMSGYIFVPLLFSEAFPPVTAFDTLFFHIKCIAIVVAPT